MEMWRGNESDQTIQTHLPLRVFLTSHTLPVRKPSISSTTILSDATIAARSGDHHRFPHHYSTLYARRSYPHTKPQPTHSNLHKMIPSSSCAFKFSLTSSPLTRPRRSALGTSTSNPRLGKGTYYSNTAPRNDFYTGVANVDKIW